MFAMCAPPFVCGGGRQALTLAKKLAELGISVTFLTINLDGRAPQVVQSPNLTIKRITFPGRSYWQTMSFGFWSTWYLWRHRHEIDVVHYPTGAFLYICPSLLLARLLGKPTLVKLTAMGVDDPASILKRRFWGRFFLSILKQADRIILTTADFEQSYAQTNLDQSRAQIIVNGVDTEKFKLIQPKPTHVRQQLKIPLDAPLVLMVGRVNLGKGADLLWAVWPHILKKHPQAHLLIIGEPTEDRLPNGQNLISTLQQMVQVHILPYQQEIVPYYQSADLFVLPSRSEGLPNATLEAMAVGLPVVISDIGGHREITHEQKGARFFPSGDAAALKDAILDQLDQINAPPFLLQNRSAILNRFALNHVAQQYIELYQCLIKT